MKQWFSDLSGLASLKQVTANVPEPDEDEVLVEIRAVSLNHRDVEGESTIILLYCNALPGVLRTRLQ